MFVSIVLLLLSLYSHTHFALGADMVTLHGISRVVSYRSCFVFNIDSVFYFLSQARNLEISNYTLVEIECTEFDSGRLFSFIIYQ